MSGLPAGDDDEIALVEGTVAAHGTLADAYRDDIPPGPADRLLITALDGLGQHHRCSDITDAGDNVLRQIRALDTLGVATAGESAAWRRVDASLKKERLTDADGAPLPGSRQEGCRWRAGRSSPSAAPICGPTTSPPSPVSSTTPPDGSRSPRPITSVPSPRREPREAGWLRALLAERAARGPAPWRAAAAEEFARLTGVTETVAKLVVAGLPYVDSLDHGSLAR